MQKVTRIVRDLIQLLQKQNGAVFFVSPGMYGIGKMKLKWIYELQPIYDSVVSDDAYSSTQ